VRRSDDEGSTPSSVSADQYSSSSANIEVSLAGSPKLACARSRMSARAAAAPRVASAM